MTKRPTKTPASSGRSMSERKPVGPAIPHPADGGPALSDEMRNPVPDRVLSIKELAHLYVPPAAPSTLPVQLAEVEPSEPMLDATGAPLSEDDTAALLSNPQGRRSARALVPILADGALYLPGTDSEMVPLTFEAYGELVAARLIEPASWDSLDVVPEL